MDNLTMDIRDLRVKIFSRSFSKKLYVLSKTLYDDLGWETVRLTDQSADGYFHTMLQDTSCDIAVNIDEDAFVVDMEAVREVIRLVVEGGYANAGCPDGGSGCPRGLNPIVTNPFFNVFNLKLIREKYTGKKQIKQFDFMSVLPEMVANYPVEILKGKWSFESTDFEPYYPFFFWLAYNFKTFYLVGEKHKDGLSTVLRAPSGRVICLHSWMARFYTMPSFMVNKVQKGAGKQKVRIDALIDEAYAMRGMTRPSFNCAQRFSFQCDKVVRWCIKVPQRVAGWPRKLKKKWQKRKQKKSVA